MAVSSQQSEINGQRSQIIGHSTIVAWGWDVSLVRRITKRGVPRELMPTDEQLDTIRHLSHRRTALSAAGACGFAPIGVDCFELKEVQALLDRHGRVVLKAPWSGSGRGLRWVDNALSAHDADWLEKLLATQGSVIVEPRCEVVQDFALEYYISSQQLAVSSQQSAVSSQVRARASLAIRCSRRRTASIERTVCCPTTKSCGAFRLISR